MHTTIELGVLGFILGSLLLRLFIQKDAEAYPSSLLWLKLSGAAAVGGLAGARLWEALKEPERSIGNPFDVTGGSAWYGGFLTATLLTLLLLRWLRLPILRTLDLMVPAVCLGQVLGRLGCFFSGCCFGILTTVPWGVILPGSHFPVPVHPTPLYEAGSYLMIFFALMFLLHPRKKDGVVFASYAILAGTARFLVEFLRVNPRIVLGLTEAQVISTFLIASGLTILSMQAVKGKPNGTAGFSPL